MQSINLSLLLLFSFMTLTSTGCKKQERMDKEMNRVPNKELNQHKFTNHLANESSPYLLQHAHNPVNWYPWGEEALKRAKTENRPIFLSIGYSACHWCHVMEKESFENKEVADFLNEHFISIKVDREERPDLDSIYMNAVTLMTGSGGWPMSVFLTPERKPFFGGTYFPRENRYGRPGFISILKSLSDAWDKNPGEVIRSSVEITNLIASVSVITGDKQYKPAPNVVDKIISHFSSIFDSTHGGFGRAPKFPRTYILELLLRKTSGSVSQNIRDMLHKALKMMAFGGMYDQIGGGFHRYSTDSKWLVPHFEKMLYDNALLAEIYAKTWQFCGNDLYKRISRETLDYISSVLRDKRGGFYSSEDADSDGEEGKFYVWTHQEIIDVLGKKDGDLFAGLFNIKPSGNFHSREAYHKNKNIPHLINYIPSDKSKFVESLKSKLFKSREKRIHPHKDDKIITSWNGLAISSFTLGYRVFGEEKYLKIAQEVAHFIMNEMFDKKQNILHRIYRKGKHKGKGYIVDYMFMAKALLDLYESDFNPLWLDNAKMLVDIAIEQLWDKQDGGFYFSFKNKNLISRTKKYSDNAIPSGNGIATGVLFRLGTILNDDNLIQKANEIAKGASNALKRNPYTVLSIVTSLMDFEFSPPIEVVILGDLKSEKTKELIKTARSVYLPGKIMIHGSDGKNAKTMINNNPTAYVCRDSKCLPPVNFADGLNKLLKD